jgi:hypothetical protein
MFLENRFISLKKKYSKLSPRSLTFFLSLCLFRECFSIIYIVCFTGCNGKVRINFGHEYDITKQERNVHNNMCPETFNLCYS